MESIENSLQESSDFHRYYVNDDTSSSTLSFGTNASGTAVDPVIENESPDIEKSIVSWEDTKWKLQKGRDFPSISENQPVFFNNLIKVENFLYTDIPQVDISLQFSNRVENLIIHNPLFRRFITQIEKGLNKFIEYEKLSLKNTIFFEEDWEIPNFEKLVLSLDFQGIPFDREMVMWKKMNDLVYGGFNLMILSSPSEEDARRIRELKRKFFIKLKM